MIKSTYNIGQRCMAYILLISLFLQSCSGLAIPTRPIPVEEEPITSSVGRSHQKTNNEKETLAHSGKLDSLALTSAAELPITTEAEPNLKNIQAEAYFQEITKDQGHLVNKLPAYAPISSSKNTRKTTVSRIDQNHLKSRKYTPATLAQQKALKNRQFMASQQRQIPEVVAKEHDLRLASTSIDTKRASVLSTHQSGNNQENYQPNLTDKIFRVKGGHQVKFKYTDHGSWQAEVRENSFIGFSRKYILPVYIELGIRLGQVANYAPGLVQQRIHVILPKVSTHQSGYVYVGKRGLLGGMEQESDGEVYEEDEEESYGTDEEEGESASKRSTSSIKEELELIEDWAPTYDFANTHQEWEYYVQAQSNPNSHTLKYYEIPDFIQASQCIQKFIKLKTDCLLVEGIVLFRTIAKRIGIAPIKEHYSEEEIEFLGIEILGLSMALQGNMNNFKWVSHDLRDISPSKIEQAITILKDEKESKSQKRKALKKVLYARIPWRKLEGLGKFVYKLGQDEYVADELKVFKDALPGLIQDFRKLTEALGNIIRFYQDDMIGVIKWDIPDFIHFPAITGLGSSTRDQLSLERIKEVIEPFLLSSLKDNTPKNRYALMRALNVIGECSVILSPEMRKSLLTEDSWQALKAIRNAFHDSRAQKQLHEILLDPKGQIYSNSILDDLNTLIKNIRKFESCKGANIRCWNHIKVFYNSKESDAQPNNSEESDAQPKLENVIDIYRRISGYLTLSEQTDLIGSIRRSFAPNEEALAFVKKILFEVEKVDYNDRKSFTDRLNKLKLSKSGKSKIEEAYKKRCAQEIAVEKKEAQVSKLSKKDQKKPLAVLEEVVKKQKKGGKVMKQNKRERLEDEAKNIHKYEKWSNLEKALKELGLTSEDDLAEWKEYYQIIVSRSSQQKDTHVEEETASTQEKVNPLCEDIKKVLEELKTIFIKYEEIKPEERINEFITDPITILAGQYLISCFREKAQRLWDILSSAASGKKNKISEAADLLDVYIRRAKEILHNHDITDITTLTREGQNLSLITTDIPLLVGDLLNIEFILPPIPIDVYSSSGCRIQVSIVDSRSKNIEQEPYPCLSKSTQNELNKFLLEQPGNNLPFKELYDHLSLYPADNPCYLLYTPPQKPESILTILTKLTSKEIIFPKQSPKSSNHEPKVIAQHTGSDLSGQQLKFAETATPEDNDCALHCLDISRKEAKNLLLDGAGNEEVHKLFMAEITEALLEDNISAKAHSEEIRKLREQYFEVQQLIDKYVQKANQKLRTSGKTGQELLYQYKEEEYPVLATLRIKLKELDDIKNETYKHIINEEIHRLVADEITEALLEDSIPEKMRSEEICKLSEQYFKVQQLVDKYTQKANQKLGTSGKTGQELLYQYKEEEYLILATLRIKIQELDNIRNEIYQYAIKKETFEKFVRLYVGQSGQWLSYIRGIGSEARTTSLDAIAKLKGISLTIWIKNPITQKLYVVHTFNEGHGTPIHMLHTHGLTHFNLLRRINV